MVKFLAVLLLFVATAAVAQVYPQLDLNVTGRTPALRWNPPNISVVADSGSVVQLSSTLTNTGTSTIACRVFLDPTCDVIFALVNGGGSFNLGPGQSRIVTVSATPRDNLLHRCKVSSGP